MSIIHSIYIISIQHVAIYNFGSENLKILHIVGLNMAEFKIFLCNVSVSSYIIFKTLYLLWFKHSNGHTRVELLRISIFAVSYFDKLFLVYQSIK